jgi:hypothetical protein
VLVFVFVALVVVMLAVEGRVYFPMATLMED